MKGLIKYMGEMQFINRSNWSPQTKETTQTAAEASLIYINMHFIHYPYRYPKGSQR